MDRPDQHGDGFRPLEGDHHGFLCFDLLRLLCGGEVRWKPLEFLEVKAGAYGGRPQCDRPNAIDNLMADTRNSLLDDLAMHIPVICESCELCNDVAPGAKRSRSVIGVNKAQRIVTDVIFTHELERHANGLRGNFGNKPGTHGRCEIYIVNGCEIWPMQSKFHRRSVKKDNITVYYSPCGGGFGSPLEHYPQKEIDHVLDGYCSPEDVLEVYWVVLDLDAEVVDLAATCATRDSMH